MIEIIEKNCTKPIKKSEMRKMLAILGESAFSIKDSKQIIEVININELFQIKKNNK